MNNTTEVLDAIKTGDNNKLSEIINDNPSIADMKTEQGISLLQLAAYCRNKSVLNPYFLESFSKTV